MPAAKKKSIKPPTPLEKDFHEVAMAYLNLALPSHAVATTFPAGGGGHKNASGFQVPFDQISQFEITA